MGMCQNGARSRGRAGAGDLMDLTPSPIRPDGPRMREGRPAETPSTVAADPSSTESGCAAVPRRAAGRLRRLGLWIVRSAVIVGLAGLLVWNLANSPSLVKARADEQ